MFFEYIKNFDDYSMFSLAHILYFVFCIVIAFVLAFVLGRIRTDKARRIVSFVVAGVVLTLHAAMQIWRVASFAAGRGGWNN